MFIPVRHAETIHVALSRMVPHAVLFTRPVSESMNLRATRRVLEDSMNLDSAVKLQGWGWCYDVTLEKLGDADTIARWLRQWLIIYRQSSLVRPGTDFSEIVAAQNFLTANIE